jgi:hypothetical protein
VVPAQNEFIFEKDVRNDKRGRIVGEFERKLESELAG